MIDPVIEALNSPRYVAWSEDVDLYTVILMAISDELNLPYCDVSDVAERVLNAIKNLEYIKNSNINIEKELK